MGEILRLDSVGKGGALVVLFVLLCIWLAPVAAADEIHLDLYEKIALAPLVVQGEVVRDPQRRATIRVNEVIKGEYPHAELSVAFRLVNFERPFGQEKIVFSEGEEVLLCLVPLRRSNGSVSHSDRFILFKGSDGKIVLPAEGRQAWLDAARRAAEIAAIEESGPLFDALRGLVWSENPLLVEIGLRQIAKHKLVDESILPALLGLVNEPHGAFGARALELTAELLQKPSRHERPLAIREHLVSLATTLADQSGDPGTRRAAVRLLASEGTLAARAKLQAIAEADPSQDVRYEAAVAVYRLRNVPR
ncbi:MAG: hypothetical protein O7F16_02995 [Acidobacteria bacterium]|nr:hypothetical protein [Acidobacteriota bacterium]